MHHFSVASVEAGADLSTDPTIIFAFQDICSAFFFIPKNNFDRQS